MRKKILLVISICFFAGLLTSWAAGNYVYSKTNEIVSQDCNVAGSCKQVATYGQRGFPFSGGVSCIEDTCHGITQDFYGIPFSWLNVFIFTTAYTIVSGLNIVALSRLKHAHTRH